MEFFSIKEIDNHKIKSFKSNSNELNVYFHSYALKNEETGIGRTFVYYDNEIVKGFVTLCNSEVGFKHVPHELTQNLPRYPIPAVKIARLAVDSRYERQGIGTALLKEALLRIVNASLLSAVYFVIVDAKEESIGFYEKYGFTKLLDTESTYFISVSTLIKAIIASKK